jgi:putative Flp pilus-assembly TadE/G-like protein
MLTRLDLRSALGRLRDERGAALAWFALSLPVLILAAAFVVNFAKWFEDKRHLQTEVDAAALAGGQNFSSLFASTCDDTSIATSALQYAGDGWRAVNPYNPQVSDPSSVHIVLNGDDNSYWKTGDPNVPAQTWGNLGSPCSMGDNALLDVKATHDQPSSFFGSLVPSGVLPAIHAHAQVKLETLTGEGALPVAVPQPTPLNARAYFVNEATGAVLGSVPLFDSGVSNVTCGGECWTSFDAKSNTYYTFAVPTNTTVGNVSVRVALSENVNNNQCGQALVACYDDPTALTNPSGIDHIRVYDQSAPVPATAPFMAVYGATLTPGAAAGCGNAYFAYLAGAANCTVRLHVRASLLSNATTTLTPANIVMTAGLNGTGTFTMASSTAASCPTGPGLCWESSQDIPVSRIGWNGIDLTWADTTTTDKINGNNCKNGNNPCTGTVSAVQRVFVADPTVSGQVALVDVLDGTNSNLLGQHNYDESSATVPNGLGVEVGVSTGFTAAQAVNSPVVFLRVAGKQNSNNNASQNQSLNCDPPNAQFVDELENGCQTEYVTNTGTTCPANASALFSTSPPYQCVPVETGNETNAVGKALNFRLEGSETGALGCIHPNNWPTVASAPPNWTPQMLPQGDPRRLQVFLTPFNTFQGSGQGTFPIVGFGTFYVTGWTGNGQNDDPCPRGLNAGQDTPIPGGDGGVLAGRFITYIARLQKGGKGIPGCNLSGLNTCIVVLTQ